MGQACSRSNGKLLEDYRQMNDMLSHMHYKDPFHLLCEELLGEMEQEEGRVYFCLTEKKELRLEAVEL